MSRQELTRLGSAEVYRDHEERIRFQRDWIVERGEFSLAPEELIDLGEGGVFVSGRIVGRGVTTGTGFENYWAHLLSGVHTG